MSRARSFFGFLLWNVLPVTGAAAVTVFGALGQLVAAPVAPPWRIAAVVAAVVLALLLVAKSVRDRTRLQSIEAARYDAVRELHNRLAPALDLMTEMAFLEVSDRTSRRLMVRNVASDCCSALVALTPSSKDVRAAVFEFVPPDTIAPLARFGRQDLPRTFSLTTPEGKELMEYLESGLMTASCSKEAPTPCPAKRSSTASRPIRITGTGSGVPCAPSTRPARSRATDDELRQ